jgi:DNA helicase HerA-like ATPase
VRGRVFDEAHKYVDNPDLVEGLIGTVREMRHKGTSVLVASQYPVQVPPALIELSTHIVLHRFNSPQWLKHIQKANTALAGLSAEKLAQLASGEAYVWANKATDVGFTTEPIKMQMRPRVTLHGGATKTAL